jgi:hypothetical protein
VATPWGRCGFIAGVPQTGIVDGADAIATWYAPD